MHKNLCASVLAGALGAGVVLFLNGALGGRLNADPRSAEERLAANRTAAILEQSGQVFEAVSDMVSPAVVSIEARHPEQKGKNRTEDYGSGVIYRPRPSDPPLVITNLHVLGGADADSIDVILADGRACKPTRIWRDHDTDLALMEIPLTDVPTAKLGDSEKVGVGQWVLVVGSPFGLSQSTTHGIISARNRRHVGMPGNVRIKEFLQTDAPINPGNSGGPLVNLKGEVIGINTAIASYTGKNSGVGFSIPSNIVRWVAQELVAHGKVRRSFLGVSFPGAFDSQRATQLGLSLPKGALVQAVHPESPAYLAGVRANDVIMSFAGREIEDDNHLINIVAQTPIGESVPLSVWRNRTRMPLKASLVEWAEK